MDIGTAIGLTLALGAGAVAKGATGMGLPLIALPALTALVGIQHAIGIMLIPALVTNVWQVWRFRAERSGPALAFLARFLVSGALGVAAGTWALDALPERSLVMALGLILLGYVALRLVQPDFVVNALQAKRFSTPLGFGAGALQGATGVSAPLGVSFIHAMRLPRPAHVFAVSTMFLGFALVQFAAMTAAGIYRLPWLAQGLFALLPVLALMPVGEALARRFSRQTFDRVILAALALLGVKLLIGG